MQLHKERQRVKNVYNKMIHNLWRFDEDIRLQSAPKTPLYQRAFRNLQSHTTDVTADHGINISNKF